MKRKDYGKFEIVSPDAPTIEVDVVPCGHCGFLTPNAKHCKEAKKKAVTLLEGLFWESQGKKITYHCGKCNRQVCGRCSYECVPMEQYLENVEQGRDPGFRPVFSAGGIDVAGSGIVLPPSLD